MLFPRQYAALVGALVVLCCFASLKTGEIHAKNSDEPRIAVNIVNQRGTHLTFPYYSNSMQTIDPRLRRYLTEDVLETLDAFQKLVDRQLATGRLPGRLASLGFLRAGPSFASMVSRQHFRRRELLKKVENRSEFNNYLINHFDNLMVDGLKYDRRNKELEFEKLRVDFRNFVEDLKEAIVASPVAMYLRWDQATYGKRSFNEAASQMIARLKFHGLAPALNALSTTLYLFGKLSLAAEQFP